MQDISNINLFYCSPAFMVVIKPSKKRTMTDPETQNLAIAHSATNLEFEMLMAPVLAPLILP